jgi:Raf kinase inhibitor-like YbhB/YbcL family protein
MSISIISTAFNDGTVIPKRFTCDGENVSPSLKWSAFPAKTRTFALIADDPDAPRGTWVHWVIFNIPVTVNELQENFPHDKIGADGIKQGKNDSGDIGYDGPCPPSGTHRYFFKIYALDVELDLDAGCTKQDLLNAMEGHILAQGQLMGRYHH